MWYQFAAKNRVEWESKSSLTKESVFDIGLRFVSQYLERLKAIDNISLIFEKNLPKPIRSICAFLTWNHGSSLR